MLVKLKNIAKISIFCYMLSRGEGRSVFEKTVHAMGNDYNEVSARHSRPFYSSVVSSDFVCALLNIVEGFKAKLVPISKELFDEDLENMKFIMGEHLPQGDLQRVKMAIHLFDLMMKHKMLSATNLDQLDTLLVLVNRQDLSLKLQKIKGKQ